MPAPGQVIFVGESFALDVMNGELSEQTLCSGLEEQKFILV